jgi:pyruvate dehydrogenase E2 component (dihydrolipoamide acetyltransferase)
MKETVQSLDYEARWLRDGLQEATRGGAFEVIDIDVTQAAHVLKRLKTIDRGITWTHIFVRAVALTLARNPEVHLVIAGNKKLHPRSVDVGLSIAADASVTPVLVIEDAANKDIFTIAAEVVRRTPQLVREYEQQRAAVRRWGWIIPLSVLRRRLLRFVFRRVWLRRRISGTFQVTCVPQVDVIAPLIFNTAAAVGVGRVRDRVIAVDGVPVVRPVVTFTCCLDHSVWNGMAAARFLIGLRQILESSDFVSASELETRMPAVHRSGGEIAVSL